jgi:hypothetical protein
MQMYALVLSTSSNDDSRTIVSLINAQSRDAVPWSDRCFTLSSRRVASASDGDGGSAV